MKAYRPGQPASYFRAMPFTQRDVQPDAFPIRGRFQRQVFPFSDEFDLQNPVFICRPAEHLLDGTSVPFNHLRAPAEVMHNRDCDKGDQADCQSKPQRSRKPLLQSSWKRGLFRSPNGRRPLPPRGAGEEDFRLDARRKSRQDPCHLAWQVNEILRPSWKRGSDCTGDFSAKESDSPAGKPAGVCLGLTISSSRQSRSPAGTSAQYARRWREEGILSALRYLVFVRRASL